MKKIISLILIATFIFSLIPAPLAIALRIEAPSISGEAGALGKELTTEAVGIKAHMLDNILNDDELSAFIRYGMSAARHVSHRDSDELLINTEMLEDFAVRLKRKGIDIFATFYFGVCPIANISNNPEEFAENISVLEGMVERLNAKGYKLDDELHSSIRAATAVSNTPKDFKENIRALETVIDKLRQKGLSSSGILGYVRLCFDNTTPPEKFALGLNFYYELSANHPDFSWDKVTGESIRNATEAMLHLTKSGANYYIHIIPEQRRYDGQIYVPQKIELVSAVSANSMGDTLARTQENLAALRQIFELTGLRSQTELTTLIQRELMNSDMPQIEYIGTSIFDEKLPAPEELAIIKNQHKPDVIVFGGGNGTTNIARCLIQLGLRPACGVSMSDDGGASRYQREDLEFRPPGDIRNVVAAIDEFAPMRAVAQTRLVLQDAQGTPLRTMYDIMAHTLAKALVIYDVRHNLVLADEQTKSNKEFRPIAFMRDLMVLAKLIDNGLLEADLTLAVQKSGQDVKKLTVKNLAGLQAIKNLADVQTIQNLIDVACLYFAGARPHDGILDAQKEELGSYLADRLEQLAVSRGEAMPVIQGPFGMNTNRLYAIYEDVLPDSAIEQWINNGHIDDRRCVRRVIWKGKERSIVIGESNYGEEDAVHDLRIIHYGVLQADQYQRIVESRQDPAPEFVRDILIETIPVNRQIIVNQEILSRLRVEKPIIIAPCSPGTSIFPVISQPEILYEIIAVNKERAERDLPRLPVIYIFPPANTVESQGLSPAEILSLQERSIRHRLNITEYPKQTEDLSGKTFTYLEQIEILLGKSFTIQDIVTTVVLNNSQEMGPAIQELLNGNPIDILSRTIHIRKNRGILTVSHDDMVSLRTRFAPEHIIIEPLVEMRPVAKVGAGRTEVVETPLYPEDKDGPLGKVLESLLLVETEANSAGARVTGSISLSELPGVIREYLKKPYKKLIVFVDMDGTAAEDADTAISPEAAQAYCDVLPLKNVQIVMLTRANQASLDARLLDRIRIKMIENGLDDARINDRLSRLKCLPKTGIDLLQLKRPSAQLLAACARVAKKNITELIAEDEQMRSTLQENGIDINSLFVEKTVNEDEAQKYKKDADYLIIVERLEVKIALYRTLALYRKIYGEQTDIRDEIIVRLNSLEIFQKNGLVAMKTGRATIAITRAIKSNAILAYIAELLDKDNLNIEDVEIMVIDDEKEPNTVGRAALECVNEMGGLAITIKGKFTNELSGPFVIVDAAGPSVVTTAFKTIAAACGEFYSVGDLARYVNRAYYLNCGNGNLGFSTEEMQTNYNARATVKELLSYLRQLRASGRLPADGKAAIQEWGIGNGMFMNAFFLAASEAGLFEEFPSLEYHAYDFSQPIIDSAQRRLLEYAGSFKSPAAFTTAAERFKFAQMDLQENIPLSNIPVVWIRFEELYDDFGGVEIVARKDGAWRRIEMRPVYKDGLGIELIDGRKISFAEFLKDYLFAGDPLKVTEVKNPLNILGNIAYEQRAVPLSDELRAVIGDYLDNIDNRIKDRDIQMPINMAVLNNLKRLKETLKGKDCVVQFFDYGFYKNIPNPGDKFAGPDIYRYITCGINFDYLTFALRKLPDFDFMIEGQREYQERILGNIGKPINEADYSQLYLFEMRLTANNSGSSLDELDAEGRQETNLGQFL